MSDAARVRTDRFREAPRMPYAFDARTDDGPFPMRTLVWLLANAIDREALGLWCKANVACDRIETFLDLQEALTRCRRLKPSLLVVDPAVSDATVARSLAAVRSQSVQHLLVLDRRPREGQLVELVHEPAASYLSRSVEPAELAAAIEAILSHGVRAIDPALRPRLRQTDRGFEYPPRPEPGTVAALTVRERQVMRLLAQGKSVRQCAQLLGVAASTVDNHKSRLMKKLGIHKASQLTYRAVRDGLITL
jgi:two-component system response regulator NreC